ncbi:MAG: DUF4412 domain-containing protein [Flavobacteriales bacterium]|nr:DUF4412 domain-containing protein [Flavobacteriales bacterium]
MKSYRTQLALVLILTLPAIGWGQNLTTKNEMGGVFSESVDVPDKYHFDHSVKMELTTTDDVAGTDSEIVFTVWYSNTENYIGMKPEFINGQKPVPNAEMVVDFEGERTITFLNASTSKMAMVYPVDKKRLGLLSDSLAPKITETDRYQKILGYKCREYLLSTEEMEGKYWLTTELDLNTVRSLQALNLQIETGLQNVGKGENGFIMKYQTTKKSNGEHSELTVVDVKLDGTHTISTGDYMFTSMPEVQGELSE